MDVVALPMYFFDGARGGHVLNNKFKKGSRVIQLIREWQTTHIFFPAAQSQKLLAFIGEPVFLCVG